MDMNICNRASLVICTGTLRQQRFLGRVSGLTHHRRFADFASLSGVERVIGMTASKMIFFFFEKPENVPAICLMLCGYEIKISRSVFFISN